MRDGPGAIHHHYLLWEDWRNGMHGNSYRDTVISDSAMLLSQPSIFAEVLNEVGKDWPIATAQNLSNIYRNHQPWCGRAACSYEFGATIREVNTAWADLNAARQVAANLTADTFTYTWRTANMKGQMQWPI
jgi:hypothetical protein